MLHLVLLRILILNASLNVSKLVLKRKRKSQFEIFKIVAHFCGVSLSKAY
jgi:hypothetical protein